MAKIDVRNERLEEYTEKAEAIKQRIKDIADNKQIEIESGVDTPLSLLLKIANNIGDYNITSVDNGDGTQTLYIFDASIPLVSDNTIINDELKVMG